MSYIEAVNSNEEENENPLISQPKLAKDKVHGMFQELEILALQKGSRNSIDLNKLDKGQIDKLLDTMAENEKNAFAFHSMKLEAIKVIELRRIDASIINQRTLKFVLIGACVFVAPLITLLILFFREDYFIPWLTFLTGILGGFGLSKASSSLLKESENKNPIQENED